MNIDAILSGAETPALPEGHFISGAFTGLGPDVLESFDAGRGQAFGRFANGSAEDVDRAVLDARRAFRDTWRHTAPADRGRILMRAAMLIRSRAEDLALVECLDSGKPISEARGDVGGAARAFEYYAGACDKLQGDTFPLPRGYLGYSQYEPVGVTAHVIPWNFPISTAARGIAPALAAGCAVVAKPAEQTPFSALMLAGILYEAGLPAGVCNVVTGLGRDTGAALVAHPQVDQITFTGSVGTGQTVMRAAADNVTRLVLELGGKSPVVVLDDCDQDQAIEGVLGAIYEHAGQVCSAGSRLVIERGIHDQFVERLSQRAAQLSIGHGLRDPKLGPVNSPEQLEKIGGFVDRARARGAEVLTGGAATADPETGAGWFYQPTIIADRPRDDELVQEEIFGPVLTVQIAEDAEHALALADDSQFGLVAGLYTGDITAGLRLARDLDVGQVFINEYFAGGIEVPFGGNRMSGFGREKGLEGMKSYTKLKSVVAKID
ncbi:aldehyde dehydrogenase family protein [Pseudooceanicola sp. 200-1SW]|uniref:aldehyde dehydrogenase family protein n=1 Tax=Pseudooceanicola sp. 200-1SW TaxID=3425949 RepID=UPI003D7FA68E